MKLIKSLAAAILPISFLLSVTAQSLSPEQQAKLNSLPPAMRERALEELRKMQSNTSTASQPLEQPQVVRPRQSGNNQRIESEFPASADPEFWKLESGVPVLNLPIERDGESKGSRDSEYPDTYEGELDFEAYNKRQDESGQSKKVIDQELEQFGYDLFSGTPTTFAPATEIPIPVDYVIGPGDQVRIQLFGKESSSYDLYVTREGILQVPQLGPLSVAGQTFQELKAEISRRVAEQMIGMEAFVTLGELRSIRVFMLGDVNRPGSYTVSSLSTLTNALFVSGGIRPIGSLRNIQLKRSGETVTSFDLYDLLLRGDTSNDASLQPGDVIFVPPVGKLVGIAGEIRRPAIYELKGEETAGNIIEMAGGLTPKAFPSISQIERVADTGLRKLLDIDLTRTAGLETLIQNGDTIRIFSALDRVANYVRLIGTVERPGDYEWTEGMRVSDVITHIERLQPDADLNYALVVSKDPINGRLSTRSFSLEQLFIGQNPDHNLTLHAEDHIYVFDDTEPERYDLAAITDRLKTQGTSTEPQKVVSISGSVRHPGEYPLDVEMTVSDLLRAAGGFTEDAYTLEAELMRYQDNGKQLRDSILIPVNVADFTETTNFDVKLQSFDHLLIKRIPEWTERQQIVIAGEVRFPGTYTIERGETLSHIIERAGGLTELAHPQSAVFVRESLRLAEEANLMRLRDRLQSDLATASLQRDEYSVDSVETAKTLLDQLESTEAAGRLVIDLPSILAGEDDISVKGGDLLSIPQQPQSVTIMGSVNYPTSHLFQPALNRNDYIALSGGLMTNADKRQIYVVRANGKVVAEKHSRFFPNGGLDIHPGDTIVVPIDVDRMHPLQKWTSISQIVYQIALGAAAVNSF